MAPEPRRGALARWPLLVALVCAMGALVVRYTVLNISSSAAGPPMLRGVTSQGTKFDLVLVRGRVRSLQTDLRARCADGSNWSAGWSPTDGVEVHVLAAGRAFTAVERAAPVYSGGLVGRIGFALQGSIVGRNAAQGTVRLVARFYRGERQWNACDSLDVPWAAGPHADSRVGNVAPGRQIGEYYPAVPSLATGVSPSRQGFIAKVDGVCTATYNAGARTQAQADRLYGYFDQRAFLESAYYVNWHAWQLRSLLALGQPPQARSLYAAWLGNFRERLDIERRGLDLYQRNDQEGIKRTLGLLASLKARGNLLGQEFGLVRCTSNGDRTPVPILNDGQPLPLN